MAYKALYRTYRPSTFDEVAGQTHIVKTLKNALATNKIAHAYLFTGPRGTGKTTMAKLFAKALNCDEGIGHQCNECKNCKAILDGSHPDVLEIDAASNRGINEIKDLIEKVKYSTILGRYKVYIIDEVHMMTPEAFNALLKTLEEPPEHVIFILATTEPHKILPTILSRCQRYDFTKVSDDDIRERLKIVLEKEGISYNKEAIDTIISLADGGMRDALSILDQVLAYSGNTLNEEDVLSIFSLESKEEKINLIKDIANGEVGNVLSKLNHYIQKGTDVKRLSNDLLVIFKDVLIYSLTYRRDLFQFVDEESAKEIASIVSSDDLVEMIDILLNALKEYKNVNDINPLFEVTLLKLTRKKNRQDKPVTNTQLENNKIIENSVKRVENTAKPIEISKSKTNEEDFVPLVKPEEIIKEEVPVAESKKEEVPSYSDIKTSNKIMMFKSAVNCDHFHIEAETLLKMISCSKKDIKNQIIEGWGNIKKLMNHPELGKAASLLVDSTPLVASNKFLIIVFQLPIITNKANLIENQAHIEDVIQTVFNRKLFVYAVSRNESVELQKMYVDLYAIGKQPKAKEDDFNITEE